MDGIQSGCVDEHGSPDIPSALNARQQRFVDEYLVDLNATAAYERSGYGASGAAASVNASRLLKNAKVQAAISAAQKERAERLQLKADYVIRELVKIAFSDIGAVADWGFEGPFDAPLSELKPFLHVRPTKALLPEERAGIRKIRETRYGLEIEMHDKVAALVALARYFGLLDGKGAQKDTVDGVPKIPLATIRLLQRRNEELERKRREMELAHGAGNNSGID